MPWILIINHYKFSYDPWKYLKKKEFKMRILKILTIILIFINLSSTLTFDVIVLRNKSNHLKEKSKFYYNSYFNAFPLF